VPLEPAGQLDRGVLDVDHAEVAGRAGRGRRVEEQRAHDEEAAPLDLAGHLTHPGASKVDACGFSKKRIY
jgi:hypothetical protein